MDTSRRVLTALAVFPFVFAAIAASPPVSPVTILGNVEANGARIVVQSLAGDPVAWEGIMQSVASGRSEWVDVAIVLRGGSDAGTASELHDAMFQALGKNPAYVLARAEPKYPLAILCAGRSDPLPNFKLAKAELDATVVAVENVRSEPLQQERLRCLAALHAGDEQLKRFFEVRSSK